jgi:hypothetical protein
LEGEERECIREGKKVKKKEIYIQTATDEHRVKTNKLM